MAQCTHIGALKAKKPGFPGGMNLRKEMMMELKMSFADLAKQLAELAEKIQEAEKKASAAPVATPCEDRLPIALKRMKYWRQMTSEARELLRANQPVLENAIEDISDILEVLKEMRNETASASKHWIGPKIPVKDPQQPHTQPNF